MIVKARAHDNAGSVLSEVAPILGFSVAQSDLLYLERVDGDAAMVRVGLNGEERSRQTVEDAPEKFSVAWNNRGSWFPTSPQGDQTQRIYRGTRGETVATVATWSLSPFAQLNLSPWDEMLLVHRHGADESGGSAISRLDDAGEVVTTTLLAAVPGSSLPSLRWSPSGEFVAIHYGGHKFDAHHLQLARR